MKYNHWSVWTAVVFNQVFGYVWYSPALFFEPWALAIKKSPEFLQASYLPFIASIISAAMFCYLLAWLFQVLVIDDWLRGLIIGLLIGTGFLAPTLGSHYMFMGYGPELIWIDGVKEILASGGTGIILAIWRADRIEEPA